MPASRPLSKIAQVQDWMNPTGGVGPDYYRPLTPLDTGVTNELSFPAPVRPPNNQGVRLPEQPAINYFPTATSTYAGMTFNPNNITLVYTGYYVPASSGTYEFCSADADNVVNFYFGQAAFPCGDASVTSTPAGIDPTIYQAFGFTPATVCVSRDLVAGLPYPMRIVYGNYGLPAGSTVTIAPPGEAGSSTWAGQLYEGTCTTVTPPTRFKQL
ncbi:hypothetical protein D7B24_004153 [Verticillium nonalfalfae]|uniref:PA14 domain-containing protein n=1 Tax=Verticillium nonalfalfae TaxID=1051616 RepID=A0A3M9YE87_9PEZI|nr:uncharacterized protein D7B24_004153 [Verticillium nonalfalfae]RNJ58789.1 hypothetical protein D7B24_004153 [Verticillium nonalfalfae]